MLSNDTAISVCRGSTEICLMIRYAVRRHAPVHESGSQPDYAPTLGDQSRIHYINPTDVTGIRTHIKTNLEAEAP